MYFLVNCLSYLKYEKLNEYADFLYNLEEENYMDLKELLLDVFEDNDNLFKEINEL